MVASLARGFLYRKVGGKKEEAQWGGAGMEDSGSWRIGEGDAGMVEPQTVEWGVENKAVAFENKNKSVLLFCVLLTYSYLCTHI